MPEPLEFRAIEALRDQLQGIRKASGYYYDLDRVGILLNVDGEAIHHMLTENDGPRPFVFLVFNDVDQVIEQSPDDMKVTLKLALVWVNESNPTVDEDRLKVFMRGAADVEKCLGQQDRSLGDLATDLRITGRGWDSEGSRVYASFEVEIILWRTYGHPVTHPGA